MPILLLALAFLSGSAEARGGLEEFSFLAWNDGCSVSLRHLRYPPVGSGLQGIPSEWWIGVVTLKPDKDKAEPVAFYRGARGASWDPEEAAQSEMLLTQRGYTRPGWTETVRDAPVARRAGLEKTLKSPGVFEIPYPVQWPEPRYALSRIHYSPLQTCVLLVFEDRSDSKSRFRHVLARIRNPGARRIRAQAHASNGLLLYTKQQDLYGAEEELGIAARMAPEYGAARYHHAALLAAHGRFAPALESLRAAIDIDPLYAAKARTAAEFEPLRKTGRFEQVLKQVPVSTLSPREAVEDLMPKEGTAPGMQDP